MCAYVCEETSSLTEEEVLMMSVTDEGAGEGEMQEEELEKAKRLPLLNKLYLGAMHSRVLCSRQPSNYSKTLSPFQQATRLSARQSFLNPSFQCEQLISRGHVDQDQFS